MKKSAEWVDIALRFAGIVNVVWGLIFALFTNPLFRWAKLPEPLFMFSWQLIGVGAIIFGLGYYVASFNVTKHSLLVVVGFTIKGASTVAVWKSVVLQDFALPMALYFSVKDLLWLAPFAMILYHVFKRWQAPEQERINPGGPLSETISRIHTNRGRELLSLSYERPLLLLFLPSPASSIFQNWLTNIVRQLPEVEQPGTQLVLVHAQEQEGEIMAALRKVRLDQKERINDTDYRLHSLFNLKQVSLNQLLTASLRKKYWTKKSAVDQLSTKRYWMPGVFLIYHGKLMKTYRYEGYGDYPDLASLARIDTENS